MRCLLPTGIRVAEGWRGTSFPYIQKQFATLVSRQQQSVFTQLSNLFLPSACQSSFSCLLPEQGGVTPDFRAEFSVVVPAQQTTPCITSHAALPSPCTVPPRRFGQAAVGRVMRSLPLFIPGAMGSPGEQGRAEGPTDPRSPRWCLFCFPRRWGRRGGAARSRDRAPGRGGGNCPRRAGLREWCGQRGRSSRSALAPREGSVTGNPPPAGPLSSPFPRPPLPVRLAAPTPSAASFPALRFFCGDSPWLRGPVCCPVNK